MDGRCKTCVHWTFAEESPDCRCGDCNCPKFSGGQYREEEMHKDELFVGAYDDFLVFITGEDFGCIHHKEIDDADATQRR